MSIDHERMPTSQHELHRYHTLRVELEGSIERLWKTLQDRLVAELRFAGITTVAAGPPGWTSTASAASTPRRPCSMPIPSATGTPSSKCRRARAVAATPRLGSRSDGSSTGRDASIITIGSSPASAGPPAPRSSVSGGGALAHQVESPLLTSRLHCPMSADPAGDNAHRWRSRPAGWRGYPTPGQALTGRDSH
jgi:hypothetical protein